MAGEWLCFEPHGPFVYADPGARVYTCCHAGCRMGVYPGWTGGTMASIRWAKASIRRARPV